MKSMSFRAQRPHVLWNVYALLRSSTCRDKGAGESDRLHGDVLARARMRARMREHQRVLSETKSGQSRVEANVIKRAEKFIQLMLRVASAACMS